MSWRGPIHTRLNCPPYETECVTCGKRGNLVGGKASYTVTPVPTRKLSERMLLREGGGGGSSLGTLSASTRSLSARSLSSVHQYDGMIVGTGVGSRVGGPARKYSRSSSKASVSHTPGTRTRIRSSPCSRGIALELNLRDYFTATQTALALVGTSRRGEECGATGHVRQV